MTLTSTELVVAGLILLLAAIVVLAWARARRSGRHSLPFAADDVYMPDAVAGEYEQDQFRTERLAPLTCQSIQPLSSEMRDHFIGNWREIQFQFVDDPRQAISRADDLLGEVMVACGFPVHDFAQRAKALAVDHADVVQYYRTAHAIATGRARGSASPVSLRLAMTNFGMLFDDLVNEPVQHARQPVAPGDRS